MKQQQQEQINRNIMEVLVEEEIERQIKRYDDNIKKHINRIEVATYALNRLPPLYASCHEGFNKQKIKGRKEHSANITKTVRQAFAAVQKDLLRNSTPLMAEIKSESQEALEALEELTNFLPQQDFSWKKLVQLIKPVLVKLSYQDGLDLAEEIRETEAKETSEVEETWGSSSYMR